MKSVKRALWALLQRTWPLSAPYAGADLLDLPVAMRTQLPRRTFSRMIAALFQFPGIAGAVRRTFRLMIRSSPNGRAFRLMMQTDADFIQRLLSGDPEAEQAYFSFFGALVRKKCLAAGLLDEDAEEVSQETLIRVLESIRGKGKLEIPEQLGAYVHATAKNVMAQVWRERRRHSEPAAADLHLAESEECSPELMIWNGEFSRQCNRILEGIRPRYREILSDYYIKETDRKALCRKWGITAGHSRVLIHRALKAFADKAEELGVLEELLAMMRDRPG